MSQDPRFTRQLHTHMRMAKGGFLRIETIADNGREIGTVTTFVRRSGAPTAISFARGGVEYPTWSEFKAAYLAETP